LPINPASSEIVIQDYSLRHDFANAAIADARSQTSVMVTATDALETALCFRFGNR
jgi:hypothetical protein